MWCEDRGRETGDGQGGRRTGDGRRGKEIEYKFERLETYQLALEYLDLSYGLAEKLPRSEEFNLRSQLVRAATSIVLNIAEGSTGQTDLEQARFLGMALRSLIETIACRRIIERRRFWDQADLESSEKCGHALFVKIQAMRKALRT